MSRARLGLVVAASVVAATRVLLLPDGPWEQDEAIFASGVLDYDVVRHRPQPPGFPGWIALGKVVALAVGDPLLSLRLLSCAASVATFVLLAVLLRRCVPPTIAFAAAALHAFTPTVWFHAPRAFADTPAVTLALAAIAAWTSERPRIVALGWILLAWATLVRPQLLPVFAVLAILGALALRRSGRLRAIHVALAAVVGLAVVVVVLVDTGGIGRFTHAATTHFDANERAGARWPAFADLGLVRGLGGVVPTITWITAAALGLALLARRDRRLGVAAMLVAATTFGVLFAWHVSTLPRYHPPTVTVLVPLVAITAARIGTKLGATVLVIATIASAVFTAPAMLAAHAQPLPLFAALRSIATRGDVATLVHTRGSVPFLRLARMTGELSSDFVDVGDSDAIAELRRPFSLLTPIEPLPGVTVVDTVFADFPPAAWDLSQRRFDEAHVVDRAVLLADGVGRIERDGDDEPFAWLGPRATLHAHPGADTLALVLTVPAELAPMLLVASAQESDPTTHTLTSGINLVRVPVHCATACSIELAFDRSLVTQSDERTLSARLYGAWCEGTDFPVPGQSWSPGTRMHTAAHGVTLTGFHGPERFTRATLPGAWTNGIARAEIPAGPGVLSVTLANPPPRDSHITLRTDVDERVVEVHAKPSTHDIAVGGANGRAWLEIIGDASVPAELDGSRTDRRRLGQVVLEVRYTPSE